ncbi:cryptochrome/photolyase family protein [Corynebacterium resistens]
MTDHSGAGPTLVWFRDDLRLRDNPALTWAASRGPVVGVFILESPEATLARPLGAAAAWFQREAIRGLHDELAAHNVPLLLATGDPREVIPSLAAQLAGAVTWSRRYHQPFIDLDAHVKTALVNQGTEAKSHSGYLLSEPWVIRTGQGTPYHKFTPFARNVEDFAAGDIAENPPLDIPAGLHGPRDLELDYPVWELPSLAAEPAWTKKLQSHWEAGEGGALNTLQQFVATLSGENLPASSAEVRLGYSDGRDYPAVAVTSRLSPYLRCGAVSPRTVWATISEAAERGEIAESDAGAFRRQIIWRDFAWHRLYHVPTLATCNVQAKFDRFPWGWNEARDSAEFDAWKRGITGVPLVDAGMRELWETGSMHNRVRMVVGSLLTKNLLIHWRLGEEWFWDTLVDADYACNPFNWQWVAGCGDDAAPYFRIFNPVTQAQKFDKESLYQQTWVPEAQTNGDGYPPQPIVDLKQSRAEALAVYESLGQDPRK